MESRRKIYRKLGGHSTSSDSYGWIPMFFTEHVAVSGLYVNHHIPEVQIHRLKQSFLVTHHGIVIGEAESLFHAVRLARAYAVLGQTTLETS